MKYITFRESHVYTCLAILCEDFKINKTDQEIALDMKLPYLFTSKQLSKTKMEFAAGTRLQGKEWFDLFLNQHGLEFIEEHLTKLQSLTMLENLSKFKRKALLSMQFSHGRHAVVFSHHDLLTDTYIFIIPEKIESSSYRYLEYHREDLLANLDHHVQVGFINPTDDMPSSIIDEIKKSLIAIDTYKDYIIAFCDKDHTNHRQREAFELVFHALLVDLSIMLKINGDEEELYQKIRHLSHQYIRYLKTDAVRFSIPLGEAFGEIIDDYKTIVEHYLKKNAYTLH